MRPDNDHLRRCGWLYAVLFGLVLWPVLVWRLQKYPPLDMQTVREASLYQERQREERFGPSRYREFEELWTAGKGAETLRLDPRARRLHDILWVAADQPWVIEDEQVRLIYGDRLDEWGKLDEQGLYAMPAAELLDLYESGQFGEYNAVVRRTLGYGHSNFFRYRSRVHLAFAVQAMGEEDWDEAFRQIDRAASVWRPLFGGETWWPHWHYLMTVADGYGELIRRRPPVEIESRVVEGLNAALVDARSWPRYPTPTAAANLPLDWTRFEDRDETKILTLQRDKVLASLYTGEPLTDPLMRFWTGGWGFMLRYQTPGRYRRSLPDSYASWSARPAEIAWLRRAATREPQVLDPHQLPSDMLDRLDPWTLVNTLSYEPTEGRPSQKAQLAAEMTRLQLLEIEIAARGFFRENGRWPSSVEELVPGFLDEQPTGIEIDEHHAWTTGSNADVLLPIRMGWIAPAATNPEASWAWLLSGRSRVQHKVVDFLLRKSRDPRIIEITRPQFVSGWPSVAWGVAFDLKAHPQFVTGVSVGVRSRMTEEFTLDPLHAMQMTWNADPYWLQNDAHLPRNARAHRMFVERGGAQKFESRIDNPDADIVVRARLKTADPVFAIWSPGPDGTDQGGMPPHRAISPRRGAPAASDVALYPEEP